MGKNAPSMLPGPPEVPDLGRWKWAYEFAWSCHNYVIPEARPTEGPTRTGAIFWRGTLRACAFTVASKRREHTHVLSGQALLASRAARSLAAERSPEP